jgi:hypothetical protein
MTQPSPYGKVEICEQRAFNNTEALEQISGRCAAREWPLPEKSRCDFSTLPQGTRKGRVAALR